MMEEPNMLDVFQRLLEDVTESEPTPAEGLKCEKEASPLTGIQLCAIHNPLGRDDGVCLLVRGIKCAPDDMLPLIQIAFGPVGISALLGQPRPFLEAIGRGAPAHPTSATRPQGVHLRTRTWT